MYPYIGNEQKFVFAKKETGEAVGCCRKRGKDMKGYAVESGYMGYVNGEYMLFASEMDYMDYVEN